MKTKFSTLSLALLFTVLSAGSAFADTTEKMIIKLKTTDFEIAETDISNLQVGEAETIVTESGKVIDLLRTADGVEIYVDGVMLEMPEMSGDSLHEADHATMHKQLKVDCVSDGEDETGVDCTHEMVIISDEGSDSAQLHADGAAHRIIVKKIESECLGDEEGDCADHAVWISDGADGEFGELHEAGAEH